MAVLECVFVMCLRLRVEKWDPHSGCNVKMDKNCEGLIDAKVASGG